jgi:hypothetical protein
MVIAVLLHTQKKKKQSMGSVVPGVLREEGRGHKNGDPPILADMKKIPRKL